MSKDSTTAAGTDGLFAGEIETRRRAFLRQ